MKQIPIFFTFNNNYAVPAAVALYSLLNEVKKRTDIYIYFIQTSPKNLKI